MLRLKYIEGAKPGKKLKITPTPEETRSQKYEQHRKERQLNEKWKVGRLWLVFNATYNTMTCRVCINHYKNAAGIGKQDGQSGLRGQNTFLTGCANRKVSAVYDHEKSLAHRLALLIIYYLLNMMIMLR